MSGYFSFQGFDFKRVGRLWILAVLFLILIFSGYSVYKGVVSYKKDLSEGNEFKKIEAENFKKIQNYQHYSYSGVSYLFIPASSSIFFKNPEVFSGLTSKVNAISALEINKSGKGKSVCKGTSPLKMKFSELTFYIFCILAFLIGMEPTRSRDYLRLLSSEIAAWKLHIFNILPRFIVMITLFVIIYLLMLALPLLIGVDLSQIAITHLLVYLIAAMIIILFFMLLGATSGSLFKGKFSFIPIAILLVIFMGIIPIAFDSIFENEAESLTSIYKIYSDKMKVINDWEKGIEKKYGKFNIDNIEVERKIVEQYFKEIYPKIEALEKKLKQEIELIFKKHVNLSIWTPQTFYDLVCIELSSRGFEEYLKYIDHNIKKENEFTRFWIDMYYYVHYQDNKLENFIKGDENLYKAEISLPSNLAKGIVINLVWIALLWIASYFSFKHSLHQFKKEEAKKLGEPDIKLEKKSPNAFISESDIFPRFLYLIFSGMIKPLKNKGVKGRVLMDNVDILSSTAKQDFLYLPHPDHFPVEDVKVENFIAFHCSLNGLPRSETQSILNRPEIKPISAKIFGSLKKSEKFDVVLALTHVAKKKLYLIDDIDRDMPGECTVRLKDRIDELQRSGAVIVYRTSEEIHPYDKSPDETPCYEDGGEWLYYAGQIRCKLNSIKKKELAHEEQKEKAIIKEE